MWHASARKCAKSRKRKIQRGKSYFEDVTIVVSLHHQMLAAHVVTSNIWSESWMKEKISIE